MDREKCTRYADELQKFVMDHTSDVLKQPRSFIRYPFIDPGSVYDGNVWDWDTYWPEPYLNMKHKEGVLMNMHKPFLCSQIVLISEYINDYSWCERYFDNLEKYFECYDRNYYFEHCGLYVWCDDIMIGMDNDPATFGRPKFSTANIFLNSFMCVELEAMEKICVAFGKEERAQHYREKREKLVAAIQKECWDSRDRFFYSADVDIRTRKFDWFHEGLGVFWKTLPIKVRVWSGFIPMYAKIATEEQAAEMVKHIFDEATFNSDYGVTTLAKDEKMFDLSVTNNPSNWLGPIWLIANYVVFRGLMNYGYRKEAELMYERTVKLLGTDLEKTGSLHEYYNPFTGDPIMNGGFINWNILALNMRDELDGKEPMAQWRGIK